MLSLRKRPGTLVPVLLLPTRRSQAHIGAHTVVHSLWCNGLVHLCEKPKPKPNGVSQQMFYQGLVGPTAELACTGVVAGLVDSELPACIFSSSSTLQELRLGPPPPPLPSKHPASYCYIFRASGSLVFCQHQTLFVKPSLDRGDIYSRP